MFFVTRFVIEWTLWIIFADKKRWRELFPVSILASFLGLTTDIIVLQNYTLWAYHDTLNWRAYLLDDWGAYIVTTYLFIQWLPKKKTIKRMLSYWFLWTSFGFIIEWIHLYNKTMTHHLWWNLWWSYVSGWILFWLFYKFHTIFRLARLNHVENAETFISILESSPLAIVALDINKKVMIWNSSAEQLFGWKKHEVVGLALPIVPEEERQQFNNIMIAKLNGATFYDVNLRFCNKEGRIINSIYSTSPVRNVAGTIIGTMAIFTNTLEEPGKKNEYRKGKWTNGIAIN